MRMSEQVDESLGLYRNEAEAGSKGTGFMLWLAGAAHLKPASGIRQIAGNHRPRMVCASPHMGHG